MRILITHAVMLNGGDAAIAISMIGIMKRVYGSGLEIVIHDPIEGAAPHYPELTIRRSVSSSVVSTKSKMRSIFRASVVFLVAVLLRCRMSGMSRLLTPEERRSLDDIRTADIVVSSGGTYLVENYFLLPQIFDYFLAMLFGKKLVFFTQSMGPFRSRLSRVLLRPVFRSASAIMVRDRESERHLIALEPGLATKIVRTPDAAFALCNEDELDRRAGMPWKKKGLHICFSVRSWKYFRSKGNDEGMRQYVKAMADLATHCVVERDSSVTFLSTCQGTTAYADDSSTAKEIVALLAPSVRARVAVDSAFHRPEELTERIRAFDCAISTRLHMCIIALGQGVPVLPIAYEFKTRELAKHLGVSDWVLDIEDISGTSLIPWFDRWLDDVPSKKHEMNRALRDMRKDVLEVSQKVLIDVVKRR